MPLGYAHAPIDKEVDLDSVAPADAAGAHAVNALDTVRREDDLHDFPFYFRAQAFLSQLIEGRAKDTPAHVDDEEAHDACSQWLEEEPALIEEDSSSDTDEYGDECQRITAVVEGLGLECRAFEYPCPLLGIAVEEELDENGDEGDDERHTAGTGQLECTHPKANDRDDAIVEEEYADADHDDRHDDRGERLELPMPVVMILILRLARDTDEDEGNDVGEEVGDRFDRLSYHCAIMPYNPDEELQQHEEGVGSTAEERHTQDLLRALGVGAFIRRHAAC